MLLFLQLSVKNCVFFCGFLTLTSKSDVLSACFALKVAKRQWFSRLWPSKVLYCHQRIYIFSRFWEVLGGCGRLWGGFEEALRSFGEGLGSFGKASERLCKLSGRLGRLWKGFDRLWEGFRKAVRTDRIDRPTDYITTPTKVSPETPDRPPHRRPILVVV